MSAKDDIEKTLGADEKSPKAEEVSAEQKMLERAVKWVAKESGGAVCPFDGARLGIGDRADFEAMMKHLGSKHPAQTLMAYQAKSLAVTLREEDEEESFHQMGGLEVEQQLDRHDYLEIDAAVKQKAKAEGAVLRWASPDRVQSYIRMGAQVVERTKGQHTPWQHSSEDTTTRSNELVLVSFPAGLAAQRRAQKESRIEQGIQARREDLNRSQEGVERAIYDRMIRQGKDKQVARQVSQAISRGKNNFRGADPNAHEGVVIRDGRGTRRIS